MNPGRSQDLYARPDRVAEGGVPDRRPVNNPRPSAVLGLIESEKCSGVTVTFIPVARATIGFGLSDPDGER